MPVPYTLEDLTRLIAKRNFCVLATQGLSAPHIVGVGYFARGLDLYIPTSVNTAKVGPAKSEILWDRAIKFSPKQ